MGSCPRAKGSVCIWFTAVEIFKRTCTVAGEGQRGLSSPPDFVFGCDDTPAEDLVLSLHILDLRGKVIIQVMFSQHIYIADLAFG